MHKGFKVGENMNSSTAEYDEGRNMVVSEKSEGDLFHVHRQYDIGIYEDKNGYEDYNRIAQALIRQTPTGIRNTYTGKLKLTPEGQKLTREEKDRSLVARLLSGNWEDKLYSFGGFPLRNGRHEMNRIVESDRLDITEQTVENNLRTIVHNIAEDLDYETDFKGY